MTRREFAFGAGSTLAATILGRLGAQGVRRKPNVIVIYADDLGYGELSVQGCKDVPTPRIDAIAANGVRFTNGYVSAPVCAPSRAGLMTGRYQQRFGFESNPGPEEYADEGFGLSADEPTLAERMKSFGYQTGMVGKWHLGFKPEMTPPRRGFDEFFGFLSGATNYLPGGKRGPIVRGRSAVDEREYLTDAFAREAVGFIEKHRSAPFFLYVAFNAVHAPLEAPPKYLKRFEHIQNPTRRTYAAVTAAMDDAVGKINDTLQRLGLQEDTLLFFVSDNGGPTAQTTSSNRPLRGSKTQLYEGGIRVPFLMQWKGRIPSGKVYTSPVISLDIFATAVVAAGESVLPGWHLDGVNLLPYVTGRTTGAPHETLYWRSRQQRAIRRGDWKLITPRGGTRPELYNMAEDIGESKNLAARWPDRVKELDADWQKWNTQLQAPRWVRQDATSEGTRTTRSPEARFQRLDRNSDGTLTADEVRNKTMFERLDANGDGMVTREEATRAVGRAPRR